MGGLIQDRLGRFPVRAARVLPHIVQGGADSGSHLLCRRCRKRHGRARSDEGDAGVRVRREQCSQVALRGAGGLLTASPSRFCRGLPEGSGAISRVRRGERRRGTLTRDEAAQRHLLLPRHAAELGGLADRRVPLLLGGLDPERDAVPAVLGGRLHHQAGPVVGDEVEQVDDPLAVGDPARPQDPGPGDGLRDHLGLARDAGKAEAGRDLARVLGPHLAGPLPPCVEIACGQRERRRIVPQPLHQEALWRAGRPGFDVVEIMNEAGGTRLTGPGAYVIARYTA